MDWAAIILTLAYAVPVALLALLLGSRIERRLLILIACLLPVGYFLHYLGLRSLLGWPTQQPTADRFTLLGEFVIEPNEHTGQSGRVYLWTLAEGEAVPRAHELPYVRGLHEDLDAASRRRSAGHAQQGTRTKSQSSADPGTPPGHDKEIVLDNKPHPRPPPKE